MASPVGHVSVGLAAGALVVRATGTPDSAALWGAVAFASMIPDVDVLLPALGFSKRYHRNATHSLAFAALVIVAGVLGGRAIGWSPGTGATAAWITALLSHLWLDVVTTGQRLGALGWGIPLLWPFSLRRFSVRRTLFVHDRTESVTLRDTLREMSEDAVRIAPACVVVALLARLWP